MGLGILLGMGGWIMWVLICLHYIVVVSGDSRPDLQGGGSREQHNYCCLAIV